MEELRVFIPHLAKADFALMSPERGRAFLVEGQRALNKGAQMKLGIGEAAVLFQVVEEEDRGIAVFYDDVRMFEMPSTGLESISNPLQGQHEVFGRIQTRWHSCSGSRDGVGETRISNLVFAKAEDGRTRDRHGCREDDGDMV